jgi:hypothetical protein
MAVARAPLSVAALLCLGATASAQPVWLVGDWCSDNGGRMVVEKSGLGLNEHTLCAWSGRVRAGERIDTPITCENVYPGDDGKVVRTDRQTLVFRAAKTGPRTISVRIGKGTAAAYAKC